MSTGSEFERSGEAPAMSPALRELVELARAQRPAPTRLTFEAVRVELGRRRTRLGWIVGGVASVAAATVLALVLWPRGADELAASGAELAAANHDGGARPTVPEPSEDAADRSAEGAPSIDGVAPTVVLAAGVRVVAADEQLGRIRIDSPWSVHLQGDTSFAIETPPGASTLDVSVATRILVVGGDSHVSVDVRDETFTVHRGRAAWAPDDVEASGGPAEDPTVRPAVEAVAADDLAALAETQLAAGQRTAAIRTFERLVLRHPRSAVTKSGLIDLARLYKLVGSPAKARCAYALHLERWPASPLRAEVQRAMESLGEGPECAGLRPQRP